jgi:hypothetical protein
VLIYTIFVANSTELNAGGKLIGYLPQAEKRMSPPPVNQPAGVSPINWGVRLKHN